MNFLKKALAVGCATAAALAVTPATGNAASSPIAACGGGSYHQIDSHKLGNVATVYLLYNGTTNCVVTWRTNPGNPIRLLAAIAKQKSSGSIGPYINDDDKYTTYAGPVKVDAPGTCIDWGGGVTLNGVWTVWYDGPSHCG
ncbi:hypothetical protein SAMN05216553_1039 [Lentzea fradiae]|uniref:Serine/threonine protein kinase n=1 Tax=Lentzea fradiae TaxID=200378 RepID=A0A1G7NGY9_9PSEU|nr:hypothetical protein [Lentzea fradiae]SDF73226.1 hypothetical protein SAMN05216553_1039 [Lentzea fradiae]